MVMRSAIGIEVGVAWEQVWGLVGFSIVSGSKCRHS